MMLLITGLPVAPVVQQERETERVTVFAGSNRKQECKYKILQIQPKFPKFLETCHSEKLQYLQGYTFYTLCSLVFKRVILQSMQLSGYSNSQGV